MRGARVAVLMAAVSVVPGMLLGEIGPVVGSTAPMSSVARPTPGLAGTVTVESFNNYDPVAGTRIVPGELVITVAGMPSSITDLSVYLRGFWGDNSMFDGNVTIVSPDGTAVDLIDGACRGGVPDVQPPHDFIVDDRATAPLPEITGQFDACWSGRQMIKPSDYNPGPPTPLTALNGHAANGDWKIRVSSDDILHFGLDAGFGFILAADDPDTAITAGPVSGEQSGSSVSFGFGSPNVVGATFECSLDGAAFTACVSPQLLSNLAAGSRAFEVRAKAAGAVDPTPAQVVWTVTPPDTRFTQHPKRRTTKRRATFGFTSTDAGSRFQCKLDRRPWRVCTSPKRVRVEPGRHVFRVRAIDTAGNRDLTPAKRIWRRTRR